MTKRERALRVLVCQRVCDMPEATIPGSKADARCNLCEEKVWRSPSSRQTRRRFDYCLCTLCAKETAPPNVAAMPLTKAALRDVMAGLRRQRH